MQTLSTNITQNWRISKIILLIIFTTPFHNLSLFLHIKSKDLHARKREPSQGFSPGASETVKHSVHIHCLSSSTSSSSSPQLLSKIRRKRAEKTWGEGSENEYSSESKEVELGVAEGSRRCSPRSVLTAKWIKSLLPSRAGAYYSLVEATTHPASPSPLFHLCSPF